MKQTDSFETKMNSLIEEYETERCEFTYDNNIKMLEQYCSRMEDSHLKCVIYTLLKQLEETQ